MHIEFLAVRYHGCTKSRIHKEDFNKLVEVHGAPTIVTWPYFIDFSQVKLSL
jgi:hypothetical protein